MTRSNIFTAHPKSVGETYGQHLVSALSFSGILLMAALCCAIHAVLPFVFERTGRSAVSLLHDRMVVNRSRVPKTVSD